MSAHAPGDGDDAALDELVEWVGRSIPQLRKKRIPRARRRHIERMHRILTESGLEDRLADDWLELGMKLEAMLGEPAPARLKRRKEKGRTAAESAPVTSRAFPSHARPVPPFKPATHAGAATSIRQKSAKPRRRATRPVREPLQMNPELQKAFDAVAAGRPIIFVTGGAGTGKSTFIHELRARFPDKQSVVLAPTGVAALNAGGQTIHSFCKLPLRAVVAEDIRMLEEREVVENLDLLIIDEVSMVRADVFDGLERFLRVNRKSEAPFGGVQIVLVGDLFQLPPVVTALDEQFLSAHYDSPHFFSARSLEGLSFTPIELQVVYRQRDVTFAGLLHAIRQGGDVAEALAAINARCTGRRLEGQYLMLVPTRKAAAAENTRRLDALEGTERRYEALVTGTFATGSDDRLPAPRELALKPKAQAMFTRNDAERRRWVNGTLGVVEQLRNDSIRVRLEDGEAHDVEKVEWQNLVYAWDPKERKIVEEVLGTFTQFPLMPAWAVTIHKAQGLTLARVAVDFGRGAFADGQVYVALSRCRSLDGLSLARPVRAHEVRCSEAARTFYARMRRGR